MSFTRVREQPVWTDLVSQASLTSDTQHKLVQIYELLNCSITHPIQQLQLADKLQPEGLILL